MAPQCLVHATVLLQFLGRGCNRFGTHSYSQALNLWLNLIENRNGIFCEGQTPLRFSLSKGGQCEDEHHEHDTLGHSRHDSEPSSEREHRLLCEGAGFSAIWGVFAKTSAKHEKIVRKKSPDKIAKCPLNARGAAAKIAKKRSLMLLHVWEAPLIRPIHYWIVSRLKILGLQ